MSAQPEAELRSPRGRRHGLLRGNVRAITFPLAALLVSDGDRVLRERVGNLLQCEPIPTPYSKEVLTAGQFGLL